jgi:predicted nucleic acid-binding protein
MPKHDVVFSIHSRTVLDELFGDQIKVLVSDEKIEQVVNEAAAKALNGYMEKFTKSTMTALMLDRYHGENLSQRTFGKEMASVLKDTILTALRDEVKTAVSEVLHGQDIQKMITDSLQNVAVDLLQKKIDNMVIVMPRQKD